MESLHTPRDGRAALLLSLHCERREKIFMPNEYHKSYRETRLSSGASTTVNEWKFLSQLRPDLCRESTSSHTAESRRARDRGREEVGKTKHENIYSNSQIRRLKSWKSHNSSFFVFMSQALPFIFVALFFCPFKNKLKRMHGFGVILSLNFHTFPIWRWTRVWKPEIFAGHKHDECSPAAAASLTLPRRSHKSPLFNINNGRRAHAEHKTVDFGVLFDAQQFFFSLCSIGSVGYARNLWVCFILQQYFISFSSVFIGLHSLLPIWCISLRQTKRRNPQQLIFICVNNNFFLLWFGRQRAPPRRYFSSCRGSSLLLLIFIWARIRKKRS